MRNRLKKRRPLSFEPLERRCVLASNLVATFDNGVLRVEGTPNADQIVIYKLGSEIKVNDIAIKNAAGKTVNVPLSQLKSAAVDALAGNDLIWVKGNLGLNVELKTGLGNDLAAIGPATKLTSNDIGLTDLKVDTSAGIWKQLEAATRDPQGTLTIRQFEIPSGIAGLPKVTVSNVKLKVTADSIQLVTGTFTLPVLGGSVTLSGAVNKDGTYTLTSAPGTRKVGSFTLENFTANVTNNKLTFNGGLRHKFLGDNPIAISGIVDPSTGGYSLVGEVPPRTLLNGNVTLSNQKVTLDKGGLKFVADVKLTKLGEEVRFEGTLDANGTYQLVGTPKRDNIAGVSVKSKDVNVSWNSEKGIEFAFPGLVEGMPPSSSGSNAKFSFSGTYGPNQWSITGTYNEPIEIGKVWLKQFTVTINKARDNRDDFVDVSCVASYLGWEALANVKGIARFYRDGRYLFKADASLIDTERLTKQLGGYKLSGTTIDTTNMQVVQDTNGRYTINDKVKTGIVSTVVQGNFKAGGFDLSRFSGIINSDGFYKFQSIDKIPLAVRGIDITKTTVFLEKGKGLYFTSTAGLGPYRHTVTGGLTPSGVLNLKGSSGSAGGFTLSNTSFVGDFDSNTGRYKVTITGTVNTPLGNGTVQSNLDGTGTVPVPTAKATVNLSGAITKLFTGSVTVTLGSSSTSFSGTVSVKGVGISKSISGTINANGTVTINGFTFSLRDLENNNVSTIGKLLKPVGLTDLNIAMSIVKNVSTSPTNVAKGLAAAGTSWNQIASTLWNSSVKSNFSSGLSFRGLGIAMSGAGLTNNVTLAVAVGKLGGIRLNQIGEAVRGAGASWDQVAKALWNRDTKALFSGGITASGLGRALSDAGVGSNYHQIAISVGRVGGMYLSDIAKAVYNSRAEASLADVAKALWYDDISRLFSGGISVGDLIGALKSINSNLTNVANALFDGGIYSKLEDALAAVGLGGGIKLPPIKLPTWPF